MVGTDETVLEDIEQAGLREWHAAAAARAIPGCDWRLERVGSALCSVSVAEPSILVNRVLGLGAGHAPAMAELVEIRRLYRDAGVSRFFLHVLPRCVTADFSAALAEAGYRRHRGWMKFVRGPDAPAAAPTTLSIRRIGPGDAGHFAKIACAAFDLTPAFQPVVAALADCPRWRLYLSSADDRPAGTGAVFVRRAAASLDWGATDPRYRRRGSQAALLHARLLDVIDAGCTTIVTMTGEAVPGDPQYSYRNILKAGFREAYLRQNWVPVDAPQA